MTSSPVECGDNFISHHRDPVKKNNQDSMESKSCFFCKIGWNFTQEGLPIPDMNWNDYDMTLKWHEPYQHGVFSSNICTLFFPQQKKLEEDIVCLKKHHVFFPLSKPQRPWRPMMTSTRRRLSRWGTLGKPPRWTRGRRSLVDPRWW